MELPSGTAQHRQESVAILGELLGAYAGNGAELVGGAGAALGHLDEGGVGEDDVGGDAPGVGQGLAELLEAQEEGLVGVAGDGGLDGRGVGGGAAAPGAGGGQGARL